MKLAVICSAHGFGHLGRQLAMLPMLQRSKDVKSVVLYTAVPEEVVRAWMPDAQVVPWQVDVGLLQKDSVREDPRGTLPLLARHCSEEKIEALADHLRGVDAVLVDVAPAGLEAARRAGCRSLAIGNFDWSWIYRHYPVLSLWSDRFAGWQAPHRGLSLWPGPGLSGFSSVEAGGLLARKAERAWRGPADKKKILVCFGGFGLQDLEQRLQPVPGVLYLLAPPMPRLDRPDCLYVDDVPFPELLAGADIVFSKPGYGILGECLRAGTPMLYLHRQGFPEAPFLERVMQTRGDVCVTGSLSTAIEQINSQKGPDPVDAPVERVADQVLHLLCS